MEVPIIVALVLLVAFVLLQNHHNPQKVYVPMEQHTSVRRPRR